MAGHRHAGGGATLFRTPEWKQWPFNVTSITELLPLSNAVAELPPTFRVLKDTTEASGQVLGKQWLDMRFRPRTLYDQPDSSGANRQRAEASLVRGFST